MNLVKLDIELNDDIKASIRREVESGRFASEDEAIVAALYLLAQKLEREGGATPETKKVLEMPLEEMLAEFRQALAELNRHGEANG